MSRDALADNRNLVFIVGCPRSGTTWLQLLLAQHPGVATSRETHLFEHFIGPALSRWDELIRDTPEAGIASVMSREEFVARQRNLASDVYRRIAESRTELVLDKTPAHVFWVDAIRELFPTAKFIHLVRDPRDVVASLLEAGSSWGGRWAPRSAFDAAWSWCEHVRAAREQGPGSGASEYRELRYEELYEEPESELEALLSWLSLDASDEVVTEAVEETSVDRMKTGETRAPWNLGSEPDGFVRKGGTGNWRADLSWSQRGVVEYVCSEVMQEFGYRPSRSRTIPPPGFYLPWLRDQMYRWL